MKHLIPLFCLAVVACSSQTPTVTLTTVVGEPELASESSEALATFAGGCFWCTEKAFEHIEGVSAVVSGFAGGTAEDPTYKEVSSGITDYREAVQITYDPSVISYEELLDAFWKTVNPTDDGGQYVDRGPQYTTAIFYHDDAQRQKAEQSKTHLAALGLYKDPIVTPVIEYTTFYPAEEYHQDYYKKNPMRYQLYYNNSGRPEYLKSIWGEGV